MDFLPLYQQIEKISPEGLSNPLSKIPGVLFYNRLALDFRYLILVLSQMRFLKAGPGILKRILL
jgi:hypothetical protein